MSEQWTVCAEDLGDPVALELWREYYTEMSDRWFRLHEGRDTPADELERELVAADDVATLGVLLVGRYGGRPAGMAGVRPAGGGDAELKRLYVRREARGTGGGPVLLAAAEDAARSLGARAMILDTRDDLAEAWSLYERSGYRRTDPHNDQEYAERWYRKAL